MGLADEYRESLKAQNLKAEISTYKKKRDYSKLIIILIAIVIAAPSGFLISNNYNACVSATAPIQNLKTNGTSISAPFSLKCATNTSLYSVAAIIVIAIASLLFLKITGRSRIKL